MNGSIAGNPPASLNSMAAWLGLRWTSEALCGVEREAARFRDSGSTECGRSPPIDLWFGFPWPVTVGEKPGVAVLAVAAAAAF